MAIRNGAKALLVHNNKILVNQCLTEKNEIYFDLPGGGQHQYETMEDAVQREVLEETGYRVKVLRFAALAEEIHDDADYRATAFAYSHRIMHIFLAELLNETPLEITEKDWQQGSLWLSLEEADQVVFRPQQLTGKITLLLKSPSPLYLGTVRLP